MWLMQSMTLLLGLHLGTSYRILFKPKPPLLSALSDFLAEPLTMQPMSLLILPVGLVLIRCGMGSPLLFRIHCTSRLVALKPALQVLSDFGLLCNLFLCCNTILVLFKKKKCLYLVVRKLGKKNKNKQTNPITWVNS